MSITEDSNSLNQTKRHKHNKINNHQLKCCYINLLHYDKILPQTYLTLQFFSLTYKAKVLLGQFQEKRTRTMNHDFLFFPQL